MKSLAWRQDWKGCPHVRPSKERGRRELAFIGGCLVFVTSVKCPHHIYWRRDISQSWTERGWNHPVSSLWSQGLAKGQKTKVQTPGLPPNRDCWIWGFRTSYLSVENCLPRGWGGRRQLQPEKRAGSISPKWLQVKVTNSYYFQEGGRSRRTRMLRSNVKSHFLNVRKTESGRGPWVPKDILLRLNTQIYSFLPTILSLEETLSRAYFLGLG